MGKFARLKSIPSGAKVVQEVREVGESGDIAIPEEFK